jgi:NAD(P)-dependent dehydrogenase (short-subunit alcohol dehydrogenase family)
MHELRGKVAVVTGGGSGIGRGMALAFAEAGMNVAVADVELPAAQKVAGELASRGVRALALHVDVAKRDAVEALAERVYRELGAAHVLCNNAGVAVFGTLDEMRDTDWRWVLSVNLEGVVHGLQAFLPRMKAQAGPKHVVNTASIAGIAALPGIGVYTASKYAVVGISETLRLEGARYELGCSVLCPGMVNTNIMQSERNRPNELGQSRALPQRTGATGPGADLVRAGRDAEWVGRRVRAAVENDEAYVFTHPETRALFEARVAAMRAGFDAADRWSEE